MTGGGRGRRGHRGDEQHRLRGGGSAEQPPTMAAEAGLQVPSGESAEVWLPLEGAAVIGGGRLREQGGGQLPRLAWGEPGPGARPGIR